MGCSGPDSTSYPARVGGSAAAHVILCTGERGVAIKICAGTHLVASPAISYSMHGIVGTMLTNEWHPLKHPIHGGGSKAMLTQP
eukprot:scaffold131182_cov30-Tisochrysis_lutea.AAC.1